MGRVGKDTSHTCHNYPATCLARPHLRGRIWKAPGRRKKPSDIYRCQGDITPTLGRPKASILHQTATFEENRAGLN